MADLKVSQLAPIVGALLTDILYIIDLSAGDAGSKNIALSDLRAAIAVTLTAGTGLSGGGDTSADRIFDLDISGITAATAVSALDGILIDDGASKRITFADFSVVKSVTFATIPAQAISSGYTQIPDDDTIPQITEGAAISNALSVTPLSSTSTLILLALFGMREGPDTGNSVVASLFKAGTNDAISTNAAGGEGPNAQHGGHLTLFASVASHGTSALEYSIRASIGDSNGAFAINRDAPSGTATFYGSSNKTGFICIEV